MRAYGSDRLRVRDDGSLELSARLPKREWYGRTEKTITRGPRPGTAVVWDEECYEVIDVVVLTQGVRYTLRPWSDGEAMRVTTRYDDDTERAREAERVDTIRREKRRRIITSFGFITGHAPGAVQDRFAHELNVNTPALTMVSTLVPYTAFFVTILIDASRAIREEPMLPLWWHVIAGYFFLESTIRFKVAWQDRRAIGSLAGVLAYGIVYMVTPKRAKLVAPSASRKGEGAPIVVSESDELWGAFHTREPLLTLLDVRDQERLRERFGFDYMHTARGVAAFLLVVGVIGVVSSVRTLAVTPRFSAVTALVAAIAVSTEQLVRLGRFARGPAPSFLRFVLRPLAKKLLT